MVDWNHAAGFWAIVILAAFFGCSAKAADIRLEWNANPPAEHVTKYLVRADEVWGVESITAETTTPTVTLTGLKRGVPYAISVVAVNSVGVSQPATITYTLQTMVILTIQRSSDLSTWSEIQRIEVPAQAAEFFRIKIENAP
jgi:hypothetical protein